MIHTTYRTPTGELEVERSSSHSGGKVYVANGEMGIVQEVDAGSAVVRLSCPERELRVYLRDNDDDSEDRKNQNARWELGWTISVHKSQGSEWPITINMIDGSTSARRLVDRHLIYTGFSRGKVFQVAIGSLAVALDACRRSNMWARKTFLREQIDDLRGVSLEQSWEDDLSRLLNLEANSVT
jgi:ATP-dependent exoDNAse (exonuclease V) alpha subunit